jgi:hypothetical protein
VSSDPAIRWAMEVEGAGGLTVRCREALSVQDLSRCCAGRHAKPLLGDTYLRGPPAGRYAGGQRSFGTNRPPMTTRFTLQTSQLSDFLSLSFVFIDIPGSFVKFRRRVVEKSTSRGVTMGHWPTRGNESHQRRHPRESGGPLVDSRPSASSGQALRGNDVTLKRADRTPAGHPGLR